MSTRIETDYLVVGAGAAGMAITDELLAHTDATVTLVDRRQAPGGHWVDAYPFVRLHQPSTFYGVGSVPLGQDSIDEGGLNAGFYELAGPDEIRAYYERVMHRHFLPTGRVRFFPGCEFLGDRRFVSCLSGERFEVEVGRRWVDTTYIEGQIPATSPPPFAVAEGVRCIPVGELPKVHEPPERFVIVGAGKTAMDACVWLLERGVDPQAIRWVKPREAWWMNRRFQQPHDQVDELYRGVALQLEAMAQAGSVDDLFHRLEEVGFFLRVDRQVEPTMFRGAMVSEAEIAQLRRIEDVVRLGHIRAIEAERIVFEQGEEVPTNEHTLHVHCASNALGKGPLRPLFEPGRLTFQPFMWGFVCLQAAMVGFLEATLDSDEEKNRLCPPVPYWDRNRDYPSTFLATMAGDRARAAHEPLARWSRSTRLNPVSGVARRRDDPGVQQTRARIKEVAFAAAINLQTILQPAEPG